MRLDLLLIARHPGLSRRKAREVIEKGQVQLEGRLVTSPGLEVTGQERVDWDQNRPLRRRARCSIPLLHADEHLVVVDKPAGMLSVPTSAAPEGEDTALARVQDYVRHQRPRDPFVGRVHRLDRDTSGALAFALTRPARAVLIDAFRAHDLERRYLVLVQGEPRAPRGTVDAPISDDWEGGRRRVARGDDPSQEALTHWRVREVLRGHALLEVELHTGRQHQVRIHLAHAGLPVLGDHVYGGRRPLAPALRGLVERQMLHAWRLGLAHPATGVRLTVEAPLPADFARVLEALRRA